MRSKLNWTTSTVLLCLFLSQACGSEDQHFGQPVSSEPVLSLAELLHDADQRLDQTVVVEAHIGSVCQTSGCWCFLEEGQEQLYVSMTTFTLPQTVKSKLCRAEGKLVMRNDRLTLLATGIELLDG